LQGIVGIIRHREGSVKHVNNSILILDFPVIQSFAIISIVLRIMLNHIRIEVANNWQFQTFIAQPPTTAMEQCVFM
jgi:hypothetical protein